jgi:DNA replication protein DnaC
VSWINDRRATHPVPPALVLPQRYAAAEYAAIPEGDLKAAVRDYATQFHTVAADGTGCLFIGRARTYKTYSAAVLARLVHERAQLDVKFVQCAVLAALIERNRFGADTGAEIRAITDTSFVVMDDFAQVPPNTYGASVLMEIAEARFANCRPTIWTGNVNATGADMLKSVANLYGAGFARRLFDGSEGFRVRVA